MSGTEEANPVGYKTFSTFTNNTTGTNAQVMLDFIDGPGISLENTNQNNYPINRYILDEKFEMYVTYYAFIEDIGTQGEDYRHALAVLPWDWRADVKKNNSSWKFFGTPSPTAVKTIRSTAKQFLPNATGERAYSGEFDDFSYTPCNSPTPVSITTKRDVAVWRKNNGVWYVMNADGSIQAATQWGVDYDIPVPGDYDGDGKADFAVYRPDNPATPEDECQNGCTWYILKSSDGSLLALQFGSREDIAVPADYDGDGKTDHAVFRPSTGVWYAVRSSDNTYYGVQFGQNGDFPVPSDYDGDGIDDMAVWSPTNAVWKILNTSNQSVTTQAWGLSSDKPVIGDYDGDGKTDIANWQSNGNWHILLSGNLQTLDVNFGVPTTDKPVPGDYDGDGKTDIAVWRPNGTQTATWFILNSSNGQIQYQYWGTEGDIPIPAAYSRQ